ncbi:MAG: hypothetical protein IEMM0008_1356 [bacterium]|nr:MAG: hypothetical protein IEMM0008_1356 [bacterium]
MKKYLSIFVMMTVLLVSHADVFALKAYFGLKAGAGIANLQYSETTSSLSQDTTRSRLAPEIGAFVEIGITPEWAVELDLMYQQRGGKFTNGTLKLDYIGLSPFFKWYPIGGRDNDLFGFYLGLGASFQFLADATFKGVEDTTIEEFNVSIPLGFGIFIAMTERMDFIFDFRADFGITNVSTSGGAARSGGTALPTVDEDIRTRAYTLSIGFRYKLY